MTKEECLAKLNATQDQDELFAIFDSLEAVETYFMLGTWKGSEIPSEHPMDGLLTLAPWYGKKFVSEEKVSPLVMIDKNGELYHANPDPLLKCAMLFCMIPYRPQNVNPHIFDHFLKLFSTNKYKARIRGVKYRGVCTAAMIYDHLEIIDVFKKIDDNTVLGVMDFKGKMHDKGYFFLLERKKK